MNKARLLRQAGFLLLRMLGFAITWPAPARPAGRRCARPRQDAPAIGLRLTLPTDAADPSAAPTSALSNLPCSSRSGSCSITAAPAATMASAFARWWWSAAAAKGTSSAGLPAAASSATVDAPLRASTRCAFANRSGMSSRKRKPASAPDRRSWPGMQLLLLQSGARRSDAEPSALEPHRAAPAMILGRCVLKMRAPCEPPKTSRCGAVRAGGSS